MKQPAPFLPLLATLLWADPTAPLVTPEVVFAEENGLVAFEAEHFFRQDLTTVRAWHLTTAAHNPALTPDPDGPHALGASGGAYLEILPDSRATRTEKLVHGENFSNAPGKLAVLSYQVHFSTPGRYHVWARIFSTGSEDNGVHFGLNGTWPESGQRWQTIRKNAWQWDSRQRTTEVHVGVPGQLYLDVPSAGVHVLNVSMREDGFELDRILLTRDPAYVPEGLGPPTRLLAGRLPAPFDQPAPHPPAAPAATELPATQFALAGSGFYLDQGKWAAINPNQHREAATRTLVPVTNGRYRVQLHAVGENDGSATYEVRIADKLVGTFTCPLATEPFEEGGRFVQTWPGVDISEGTLVEVRARVASSDGQEYSRARWSKLVFIPETAGLVSHGQSRLELAAAQRAALFRPVARQPHGDGSTRVTGELKQWHAVTVELAGPFAAETDRDPNPFTDYRCDVTFTHESGTPQYVVPGYFAADGRAAETSATAGTVWRAHLSPDKSGRWTYRVAFTRGPNAATYGGGTAVAPFHGRSGSFTVTPTDKTGRDFRAGGRLTYTGGHYLLHAGTGEPFLKAGADAPETLLAYGDFDDTLALKQEVPLKTWAPHVGDWRAGDPTWQGGKGKGLVGALNYLADKGANAVSFLTYNAAGDGDNIWPFIARDEKLHYDCSRLDQWNIVFSHAQARGIFLHFKLQENENDDHREGARKTPKVIPEALDAGATGPERRLYFREMIARFGHHLALNWNLGEENTQTPDEQRAMARFIHDTDPYHHLLVIHSFPQQQDDVYEALLGDQSLLTGASAQNNWNAAHRQTLRWVRASAAAGRPWVVCNDEQNPASQGVPPDPGYRGYHGVNSAGKPVGYDLHDIRQATLWGTFLAGGAGVEYYFGYQLPENDLLLEDFRSRDRSWDYCRIALDFFRTHRIPLTRMANADELVGNPDHDNSRYCLAEPGRLYLVYLPAGGDTTLDLSGQAGPFTVAWFNPREGGALQPAGTVTGGAPVRLSAPDAHDWLAVVRAAPRSVAVGPNPESVTRGFDGDLFVTIMGETRQPGDGNGRIVRLKGDEVAVFADGMDDPKGIVFTGRHLVTADFSRVWRIDAAGTKSLLAGPSAFPHPPAYLNDVALAPDGLSVLVTDMGAVGGMRDPQGRLWPLDSPDARALPAQGRVYRIALADGKVTTVVDASPLMPCPNGVTALPDGRILVAEFFRGSLLQSQGDRLEEIATGFRSGDGLTVDSRGRLWVSTVMTGQVWRLPAGDWRQPPALVAGGLRTAADFLLDEAGEQLIVPDLLGGTLAFFPLPD